MDEKRETPHEVVIVGGGFGGLYCAKALKGAPARVTLVDKRNFHLFQPLLYQVATGELSPGDIASPLRAVLAKQQNAYVLQDEVVDIDPDDRKISLKESVLRYDTLILATGSSHHYFGHPEWSDAAPGLKTIEDAIEIRRKIFEAFEKAEKEASAENRRALMTFALVGAGPTGVELAGAIAELSRETLRRDFRNIDTREARILLIEGTDRVLPPYPPDLSEKAKAKLQELGVEVRTNTLLTSLENGVLTLSGEGRTETVRTGVVLWAAGVRASPLGEVLTKKTGTPLDKVGRVVVEPDLTVPGHPDIFVIGDLANRPGENGKPLPGVATVAIQEGKYVAEEIVRRLGGHRASRPFRYRDKGSLAVIGRNAAVADVGGVRFDGFPAWLLWVFVHIHYLIEFDSKVLILLQWAWNYVTRKKGARLITGGVG